MKIHNISATSIMHTCLAISSYKNSSFRDSGDMQYANW